MVFLQKTVINAKINITGSSCPEVFHKKVVLKNLAKFLGKHLCWNPFLIKLQATWFQCSKRTLWQRWFLVAFLTFLRTAFLYRTPKNNCFCIPETTVTKMQQKLLTHEQQLFLSDFACFRYFVLYVLSAIVWVNKFLLVTRLWWPNIAM